MVFRDFWGETMADLSSKHRDELNDDDFAYIDSQGERHLPVNDKAHARNALARFSQTRFESLDGKKRAARRILQAAKDYGLDVAEDDDVQKASR
jgi:hypothetical protein